MDEGRLVSLMLAVCLVFTTPNDDQDRTLNFQACKSGKNSSQEGSFPLSLIDKTRTGVTLSCVLLWSFLLGRFYSLLSPRRFAHALYLAYYWHYCCYSNSFVIFGVEE